MSMNLKLRDVCIGRKRGKGIIQDTVTRTTITKAIALKTKPAIEAANGDWVFLSKEYWKKRKRVRNDIVVAKVSAKG